VVLFERALLSAVNSYCVQAEQIILDNIFCSVCCLNIAELSISHNLLSPLGQIVLYVQACDVIHFVSFRVLIIQDI